MVERANPRLKDCEPYKPISLLIVVVLLLTTVLQTVGTFPLARLAAFARHIPPDLHGEIWRGQPVADFAKQPTPGVPDGMFPLAHTEDIGHRCATA